MNFFKILPSNQTAKQFSFLLLICLLALSANFFVGPSKVDPISLFFEQDEEIRKLQETILWQIRLPRLLICTLVGMAISAAGVLSQGLFRNSLASPSVIGTSSGGVLAAVLVIYFGRQELVLWIPVAGFVGALVTTLLVIYATQDRTQGIERILLTGFSINTLIGSITSFFLALSLDDFSRAPMILNWMMGSFNSKGWEHVLLSLIPIAIGIYLAFFCTYRLNVLSLGSEIAQSLGISWNRLRLQTIVGISLLVGTSVSLVGMLPFLGLIVPHLSRQIVGADHKKLLIASMINGISLCLIADFMARNLWQPVEMQVGVLISLIGSPLFLWLLWRSNRS